VGEPKVERAIAYETRAPSEARLPRVMEGVDLSPRISLAEQFKSARPDNVGVGLGYQHPSIPVLQILKREVEERMVSALNKSVGRNVGLREPYGEEFIEVSDLKFTITNRLIHSLQHRFDQQPCY
jgi:hypothetical protein